MTVCERQAARVAMGRARKVFPDGTFGRIVVVAENIPAVVYGIGVFMEENINIGGSPEISSFSKNRIARAIEQVADW